MTEETIFVAALERSDAASRQAFLDEACAGDAALRRRVEDLLGSHEGGSQFLQRPVVEQMVDSMTEEPTRKHTGEFDDQAGETPVGSSAAGRAQVLHFLEPSQRPGSLGRLKHYEIQEVLGQGGFGMVLKAFDERLHRVVAIKVLSPVLAGNAAACQRFLREARAAAAVRHENVIGIHAVEDEPVPYLVMEFIDGPTLQQKLDRVGKLPAQEVLRIGAQIAAGLTAAHRQGLVHRDVKPSNILLENGVERVKLTDFGLARASDDTSLTQSGIVAGTPQYMSPEQAMGEYVDQRSDLFSLGTVLYAMCTGHLPFHAGSSLALLKRVCEDTPRPVGQLNSEIPLSLADDIARLHAKRPEARFQSAAEIGDRLTGYLAELQGHGSGTARTKTAKESKQAELRSPFTPVKRPQRVFQSARFLVILPGILVVGLLVGYLVMNPPWQLSPDDHDPTGAAPAQPSTAGRTAGKSPLPPCAADKLKQGEIFPALLPELGRKVGETPVELVAILGKGPFLHTEHGGHSEIQCLAYSPDGKRLASVSARFEPTTTSFSRWEVKLWDADTGKPLRDIGRHANAVHAIAFSPDSQHLVTGCRDGTVKVWDVETGKERLELKGLAPRVRGVAWSPDGKWIAGCSDNFNTPVVLWDAADGAKQFMFDKHGSGVLRVAFSPDSSLVASVGEQGDGKVRVWETVGGKEIASLTCNTSIPRAAAFSRNGKYLATGGHDAAGQVWDVAKQEPLFELKNTHTIMDIACSRDGAHFATADLNGFVNLWHAATGELIRSFSGHSAGAVSVAFHPDGKTLAAGTVNGRTHIWETATGKQLFPQAHNGQVYGVSMSPDGKLLASAGHDGTVRLWDLANGNLLHVLTGHKNIVSSVAFSPDSMLIASGSDDKTVRFWDPVTGVEGHPPVATASAVRQVAFAPGGASIATAEVDGNVNLWQLPGGKPLQSWTGMGSCWCVAFHPKGDLLAAGFDDNTIRLCAIRDGSFAATLRGHRTAVRSVAFHANGETLASTAEEGDPTVRLWNVATHKETMKLQGHTGLVLSAAWGADGGLLGTCGGTDGTVRLWDMTAKAPRASVLTIFDGGAQYLHGIALSPDSRYLATANPNGTIFVVKLVE